MNEDIQEFVESAANTYDWQDRLTDMLADIKPEEYHTLPDLPQEDMEHDVVVWLRYWLTRAKQLRMDADDIVGRYWYTF